MKLYQSALICLGFMVAAAVLISSMEDQDRRAGGPNWYEFNKSSGLLHMHDTIEVQNPYKYSSQTGGPGDLAISVQHSESTGDSGGSASALINSGTTRVVDGVGNMEIAAAWQESATKEGLGYEGYACDYFLPNVFEYSLDGDPIGYPMHVTGFVEVSSNASSDQFCNISGDWHVYWNGQHEYVITFSDDNLIVYKTSDGTSASFPIELDENNAEIGTGTFDLGCRSIGDTLRIETGGVAATVSAEGGAGYVHHQQIATWKINIGATPDCPQGGEDPHDEGGGSHDGGGSHGGGGGSHYGG